MQLYSLQTGSQNMTEIDSSSLDFYDGQSMPTTLAGWHKTPFKFCSKQNLSGDASAASKRSLHVVNEHCEQGCNEAKNQNEKSICIKVDVDTERGTRIGVLNLVKLFKRLNIDATFLFSLGPDNTGRAISRIFRRGFLKKVSRTSVISTYGLRTLLNGVILPGPHIGKSHARLLQDVYDKGFEVGIHAYDHHRWQDGVTKMKKEQIAKEFYKAQAQFRFIFNMPAKAAGAPGWQANAKTLAVYDDTDLLYASDCRGTSPFYPKIDNVVFSTFTNFNDTADH